MKKMIRRLLTLGCVAALSMSLLASCGGTDTGSTTAAAKESKAAQTTAAAADKSKAASTPAESKASEAAKPATELKGKLVASGSTSVQPLMEALAEEFQNLHPGVTVEVQAGGSTTGYKNVMNGVTEIGNMSRNLKDKEKNDELNVHTLAIDGIAVCVNPKNPVKNLTVDQIKDIFTGKITNWKDVGGKDADIVVIQREAGSGTRGAFEELLDIKDKVVAKQDANETGIVKNTVAGNENAVGYISLGSADDTVVCVDVDGVKADESTIADGTYKLSRPFLSITKGAESDLAKAFYAYCASPEAQKITKEMGFFPVSK